MPHAECGCQHSLDDFWSGTLGTQGLAQIYDIITELLTASALLITNHNRQNIYCKITDVATCKVIKDVFQDVK